MQILRDRIVANLAAFPRLSIERPDLRRAAVAILISPLDGDPSFAITRRASTLRRGPGNYARPGGACDPGEGAVAAALRETAEELGVALDPTAFLGSLDDFVTLTGFGVTPVVLWSDTPLTLTPDPVEVGEAWLNPLSELNHPEAPHWEPHPTGGPPIPRMRISGRWMNPPTAAWLYQFREVALHGRWTRVADLGQPAWTAR